MEQPPGDSGPTAAQGASAGLREQLLGLISERSRLNGACAAQLRSECSAAACASELLREVNRGLEDEVAALRRALVSTRPVPQSDANRERLHSPPRTPPPCGTPAAAPQRRLRSPPPPARPQPPPPPHRLPPEPMPHALRSASTSAGGAPVWRQPEHLVAPPRPAAAPQRDLVSPPHGGPPSATAAAVAPAALQQLVEEAVRRATAAQRAVACPPPPETDVPAHTLCVPPAPAPGAREQALRSALRQAEAELDLTRTEVARRRQGEQVLLAQLRERDAALAALDGERGRLAGDVERRVSEIAARYSSQLDHLQGLAAELAEKVRSAVSQQQQQRQPRPPPTPPEELPAEPEPPPEPSQHTWGEWDPAPQVDVGRLQEVVLRQAQREQELEEAVAAAAADVEQLLAAQQQQQLQQQQTPRESSLGRTARRSTRSRGRSPAAAVPHSAQHLEHRLHCAQGLLAALLRQHAPAPSALLSEEAVRQL
eukprot:TRINITY_DN8723_c2_g1_i1.p1 TRINITY_DN8723_c2_g1~~TRINITY_DN8723_c2_g1_i1.p1  ORF type:complete len:483 (+),score=127.84 TRINITY_DN8723_c2_g1_i1:81-1529(+)